jgi:hypothetical protein
VCSSDLEHDAAVKAADKALAAVQKVNAKTEEHATKEGVKAEARLANLETAAREAVTEWNRIENITPDFADEWTPFMDKLDAALAKEEW